MTDPETARDWADYWLAVAHRIDDDGELDPAVAAFVRQVAHLEDRATGQVFDLESPPLRAHAGTMSDRALGQALGVLLLVRVSHAVGGQVKTAAAADLVADTLRAEMRRRGLDADSIVKPPAG